MSVSIITPATAKRLTTPANVRGDLGLAATAPPEAQLNRWIDQASARVASYCRRQFGRETVRERIALCLSSAANGGADLLLDRWPVVRILGVTADSVTLSPGTYETDGRSVFLLQDGQQKGWSGRIAVVDYEAGWLLPSESRGDPPITTAPDLPADVEAAVIKLVGAAISANGRDALIKSEDVVGVGSTSWYVQGVTAALPHPEAEAALAGYRRLLFA
ncbi:hypothetical protein MOX02_35940 [Methylobacterium oxalidis]|uniref:Uncharacterized protein n=2 Tax=Methylobacterium oxalidis TaxID=944322 RepID=A0A512J6F5_9HYPH|nr:hypothetical protein MOX02_35940 [Methylobacterium oxalidis]GJE32716.1 hypothetical protein LDDCCGHA_2905 [Methylobacterium oxalidis]GLS65463.1 hypothetical protein GCM10007888_38450 [Methylobacterium oxalidis]